VRIKVDPSPATRKDTPNTVKMMPPIMCIAPFTLHIEKSSAQVA
jgi:hypothetical protein